VESISAAQAVEVLIQEYGKLVFHTIYGLTGDWEESQDLTQDTFHQALRSIDAARAKSGTQFHAKAWLLQIALNTVRMQRRRGNLFRFIPFSRMEKEQTRGERAGYRAPTDIVDEQAASVQPAGYGASEQIDLESSVAERDAIQRTMRRLSPPLRECLLLSVVGQFSTAEIAVMLDIEAAAVRQLLARARNQFSLIDAQIGGEEIIDQSSLISDTNMSQTHPPMHHSSIERVESRTSAPLSGLA